MQVITTEFVEKFNLLNNMVADVHIKHLLYGNQKIKKCVLHPLLDGARIGLIINDEDVYITMDELVGAHINNCECLLQSDVTKIELKF